MRISSKMIKRAGGLGAVGSLLSPWVAEQTSETHLWLLGRPGRGAWDPWTAAYSLLTLARSDVSVEEEADIVERAAGQHKRLQAILPPPPLCPFSTHIVLPSSTCALFYFAIIYSSSMVMIIWPCFGAVSGTFNTR